MILNKLKNVEPNLILYYQQKSQNNFWINFFLFFYFLFKYFKEYRKIGKKSKGI